MMHEIYRLDGGSFSGALQRHTSILSRNHYLKGHLLNHDLGGPGLAFNLFPITSKANFLHYYKVEYPVKKLLALGAEVEYNVDVEERNSDELPGADFICNVKARGD